MTSCICKLFLPSDKPTPYFLTAAQLPIYAALKFFSVFTFLMLVEHAHYNTNIQSLHNGLQLCMDTQKRDVVNVKLWLAMSTEFQTL
jgi:predicted SPOUT superfamily RNA methylase MTH1